MNTDTKGGLKMAEDKVTERVLSCAAIASEPVDFDFGEGFGETWETVYPDVRSWNLEKCREYLDDQGRGFPDPDPFIETTDASDLFELAVELGVEGFEDTGETSAPVVPDDVGWNVDDIRAAIISAIDNEEIDGIEDWRERVEEAMQDSDGFAPMMNYYYPLPHLRMSAEDAQEAIVGTGACVVVLVNDEPVLALAGGGMDLSPDICRAYIALGYYPPTYFGNGLSRLGVGYDGLSRETVEICLEAARISARWSQNAVTDLEAFLAKYPAEQEGSEHDNR